MWPALFQVTTVERRPCGSGITLPAESPSWRIVNRDLVVLLCTCDIYCMYCIAPHKRDVKHFEAGRRRSWLICMGLVREYDVVWGLLLLIPGVREQSPYPYTHTHTQTHTRHSPSPSTSALHQHTDKTNTTPTHNCVTHRTQTLTQVRCAHTHTCELAEARSDRKACLHHHWRVHTHTHTHRSECIYRAGSLPKLLITAVCVNSHSRWLNNPILNTRERENLGVVPP